MLEPSRALTHGIPTLVAETVAATGTDTSRPFSIIAPPGTPSKVNLAGTGTYDALAGNIEQSADGQTTWRTVDTFALQTTAVKVFDVYPGISYRLNFTTVTNPVTANVLATLT